MTLEMQIKSIKEDKSKGSLENPVDITPDNYKYIGSLEQPIGNISLGYNFNLEYRIK